MEIRRILLVFLVLSGLSIAEEPATKVFTATTDPDGIQKVSIAGGEYYFEPNHIIVKVNIPVELSVKKVGGFVPHNIEMKAPEAGMKFEEAMSAEPKVIKFTPTKVGTYPFTCSKKFLFFKSHEEKGMKGVIEVIE
jgi:plastocyanin domain-containing protein